ncbi:MAG: chemotaxis protein CheB [Myxococcales bacterium]|nr:chemotaxis protein CheB [Myxococcales bacterium]
MSTMPIEAQEIADLLGTVPRPGVLSEARVAYAVDIGEYRLGLAVDADCERALASALPYQRGEATHPVARALERVAVHLEHRLRGRAGKAFRTLRPEDGLTGTRTTDARVDTGVFRVSLGLRGVPALRVHICHPDARARLAISNVIRGTEGMRVVGSSPGLSAETLAAENRHDLVVACAHLLGDLEVRHPELLVLIGHTRAGLNTVTPPTSSDVPDVREWAHHTLVPFLAQPRNAAPRPMAPLSLPPERQRRISRVRKPPALVAIAASTGGPDALARVLKDIPADFPLPILLVQHMSERFTEGFAARLDRNVPLTVRQAQPGERPTVGTVLLAPGGSHMVVERDAHGFRVDLSDAPPEHGCRPAADVTFRSLQCAHGEVLVVVLTGMGEDGGAGALTLFESGATVIAQDEATSVVWGMPGAVVRRGAADEVVALGRIAERIVHWVAAGVR